MPTLAEFVSFLSLILLDTLRRSVKHIPILLPIAMIGWPLIMAAIWDGPCGTVWHLMLPNRKPKLLSRMWWQKWVPCFLINISMSVFPVTPLPTDTIQCWHMNCRLVAMKSIKGAGLPFLPFKPTCKRMAMPHTTRVLKVGSMITLRCKGNDSYFFFLTLCSTLSHSSHASDHGLPLFRYCTPSLLLFDGVIRRKSPNLCPRLRLFGKSPLLSDSPWSTIP